MRRAFEWIYVIDPIKTMKSIYAVQTLVSFSLILTMIVTACVTSSSVTSTVL